MDFLTSAADAILSDDAEMILTPTKDGTRHILRDLTNSNHITTAPSHLTNSSLNSLLNEQINTKNRVLPNLKTPRKRRKNSCKYGDENQAPTPKTPKNEQKFEFDDSPVTPLSNLKMLTRIASMEEHIPSKKDLFSSQPSVRKNKLRRCVSDLPSNHEKIKHPSKPKFKKYTSVDIEQSQSQDESYKKGTVIGSETSRREKSLGLLCEKFLNHFPMEVSCLETPRRLVIDDVAAALGTERRRVYDIMNILECLNMASRVQKNVYQWMGKQHLENTLSRLKGLAEDCGIHIHFSETVETLLHNLKCLRNLSPNSLGGESIVDSRKEKSIGILCQKFLILFLTSDPPHIIQLETANHLLLAQEGDDIDKLRKRGRRIYDIANVLVALRLITKLPQCKSFKYIGPSVYAIKGEVTAVNSDNKIKNRHSLLPPPISEFVRGNSSFHLSVDSEATPEDISNGSLRNGRPVRKLGSLFPHSKAKRNCLIARPKSIEPLVNQTAAGVKKCTSLEYVCKDQVEDICSAQQMNKVNQENDKLSLVNNITGLNQRPNMTKIFRFTHYGSPRMALTFSDNSNILKSPPTITDRPPLSENGVSKVIVRPPFILRKVSVPSVIRPSSPLTVVPQKTEYSLGKQINTISSSNSLNGNQEKHSHLVKAVGTRSFKVYTSGNKSTLSPASDNIMKPITSPVPIRSKCDLVQPKFLVKSLSQNVFPNINLNTLSKNHYKIGTSTQITSPILSATNSKGSFRFIINSKNNHITKTQSDPGKELKEPSFVKMLDNSPDQSSTDSEIESIFGDSFKFTRPKSLVKKS